MIAGEPTRFDHILELRPVTRPADAGAGIVAGEQHVGEVVGATWVKPAALSRSGCSQSGIGSAGAKLESSKS